MLNRIKSKQNVTFITKKNKGTHRKKSYFHQERRTFFSCCWKIIALNAKCVHIFFRKEKEALRMRSNFDSICNETEASYWIFFLSFCNGDLKAMIVHYTALYYPSHIIYVVAHNIIFWNYWLTFHFPFLFALMLHFISFQ